MCISSLVSSTRWKHGRSIRRFQNWFDETCDRSNDNIQRGTTNCLLGLSDVIYTVQHLGHRFIEFLDDHTQPHVKDAHYARRWYSGPGGSRSKSRSRQEDPYRRFDAQAWKEKQERELSRRSRGHYSDSRPSASTQTQKSRPRDPEQRGEPSRPAKTYQEGSTQPSTGRRTRYRSCNGDKSTGPSRESARDSLENPQPRSSNRSVTATATATAQTSRLPADALDRRAKKSEAESSTHNSSALPDKRQQTSSAHPTTNDQKSASAGQSTNSHRNSYTTIQTASNRDGVLTPDNGTRPRQCNPNKSKYRRDPVPVPVDSRTQEGQSRPTDPGRASGRSRVSSYLCSTGHLLIFQPSSTSNVPPTKKTVQILEPNGKQYLPDETGTIASSNN